MKGQLKRISIPEPCTMKWEEMARVDEKSRSCFFCEKVVHDFTQMSDEELISFFKTNQNVCGRFLPGQLDKDLPQLSVNSNGSFFKKIILLNSFLFSLLTVAKAEPALRKNAVAVQSPVNSHQNYIPATSPVMVTISGAVTDSLNARPVRGILVDLYYGNDSLHCFTDENGNYTFSVQQVSGLDSLRIVVDENYYDKFEKQHAMAGTLQIKIDVALTKTTATTGTVALDRIKIESMIIMGANISTCYTPRRPVHNFFYRLFHPRTW
jgi:hypothetical protein